MKPDAWPFEPPAHHKKLGESPFRARGSMYGGYIDAAQKNIPGGLAGLSTTIANEPVMVFLRETIFLVASSYDIEPLMHLLRAFTRVTRMPLDKFLREGSRAAAENDVVGKYRAQLRSASAEEMAARLPRIFSRYFDPCQAEMTTVGPTFTEMRFSGLPASALGFYVWPNEGFVSGALESVGARDIRFSWGTPVPSGEIDGVPVMTLGCRITWTNQSSGFNGTSK